MLLRDVRYSDRILILRLLLKFIIRSLILILRLQSGFFRHKQSFIPEVLQNKKGRCLVSSLPPLLLKYFVNNRNRILNFSKAYSLNSLE